MIFGCKHKWKEVARAYSPPNAHGLTGEISLSLVEKIMFGVTSIEYQCQCGEHYTATLLGQGLTGQS